MRAHSASQYWHVPSCRPAHPRPSRESPAPAPQVTSKIQTLRVELYATCLDAFRLALEVALTLYVLFWAWGEARGLYRVRGCFCRLGLEWVDACCCNMCSCPSHPATPRSIARRRWRA